MGILAGENLAGKKLVSQHLKTRGLIAVYRLVGHCSATPLVPTTYLPHSRPVILIWRRFGGFNEPSARIGGGVNITLVVAVIVQFREE